MVSAESKAWSPPSPQSLLTPLPAPPPPVGHFDPLPPPLSPVSSKYPSHSFESLLNGVQAQSGVYPPAGNSSESMMIDERATPSSLVNGSGQDKRVHHPVLGFFEDPNAQLRPALAIKETRARGASPGSHPRLANIAPAPVPSTSNSHPTTTIPSSVIVSSATSPQRVPTLRKRPRREAAVPKHVERQPSPLDLSPPLRPTGSNRKVSHSLIERRRREKINECLASLREMVPQCREEGERKEARARERGRKRGRKNDDGDDDGSRGGLHKLEILQGTILYIQELEARILDLEEEEGTPMASRSPSPDPPSGISTISRLTPTSPSSSASEPLANGNHPSSRATATLLSASQQLEGLAGHISSASGKVEAGPPASLASILTTDLVQAEQDTAAGLLLLRFSTSPELRPVFFDD